MVVVVVATALVGLGVDPILRGFTVPSVGVGLKRGMGRVLLRLGGGRVVRRGSVGRRASRPGSARSVLPRSVGRSVLPPVGRWGAVQFCEW